MKQHLTMWIGLGALAAQWAWAADPKPADENPYLRFREKDRGAALEVGVITLENAKTGAKVDLVGAVHIGDKAYYQGLNRRFKTYDAVLYEMVKPAGVDPGRDLGERPASSVSMMQRFMQKQLDLAYQLDEVNYGAKNFVHADMTAKQFQQAQKDRGESLFTLMLKMMREEMAREKKGQRAADITLTELLRALLSPQRSVDLKYIFARQFNEMERLTAGLDGKDGSAILTDRNTVALKVLAKELKAGKKKLAIFYGAAHLPDLEKRMIEKMGFKRKNTIWLNAWNLPPRRR